MNLGSFLSTMFLSLPCLTQAKGRDYFSSSFSFASNGYNEDFFLHIDKEFLLYELDPLSLSQWIPKMQLGAGWSGIEGAAATKCV